MKEKVNTARDLVKVTRNSIWLAGFGCLVCVSDLPFVYVLVGTFVY